MSNANADNCNPALTFVACVSDEEILRRTFWRRLASSPAQSTKSSSSRTPKMPPMA